MRFTVLTPTFNRAHVLPRAYESLLGQTFRDFEWLIVDDGSSDSTGDLVASWKADFPIRFHWKPNGGKHTAVNLGVRMAAGELIAQLDSDDQCFPESLERFHRQWQGIPQPERFAAVVGLCCDEHGQIIGSRYPGDFCDSFSLGQALALVNGAERWGVIRTDVWRQFPAPEFPGERFIPEGIFQNRILQKYAVRYFNEPVRIYHRSSDSLSNLPDWRWRNPRGAFLFHWELATGRGVLFSARLKSLVNAVRFGPLALWAKLTVKVPSSS